MKMIIAIVQDKDSNNLSNAFVEADVRATKLATTGAFTVGEYDFYDRDRR